MLSSESCKIMEKFPERLRSERDALKLTQDAMAARLGIPKRTYCAYEAGETAPSAKLLAALAGRGIDVAYLLTGKRGYTLTSEHSLSEDELHMLATYRNSGENGRAIIRHAVAAAAQAASSERYMSTPTMRATQAANKFKITI